MRTPAADFDDKSATDHAPQNTRVSNYFIVPLIITFVSPGLLRQAYVHRWQTLMIVCNRPCTAKQEYLYSFLLYSLLSALYLPVC